MYSCFPHSRRLVCDVVRVKVETETIINRISRGNPEDLLMVYGTTNLTITGVLSYNSQSMKF